MIETPGVLPLSPRRKRRKKRHLKRRAIKAGLWILLIVAWGAAIKLTTDYLAKKGQLGKQYHQIDRSVKDPTATSDRPF